MRPKLSFPLSVALSALALPGCATFVPPPVTPAMVSASRGASAATLEGGRALFAGRCTACHSADPLEKYPLSRWREIVADMAHRSKIDTAQESAILTYIAAAQAMPPDPAAR